MIDSEVGKQSEVNVYDDQDQTLSKQSFTYGQHSFYLNKGIYIERAGELALKFPVIKPVAGGYTYDLHDPVIDGNFKAVYPQNICNNNPGYTCLTTQDYSTLRFWITSAGGKVGTTVSMERIDYFDTGDVVTTTTYDYSDTAIDHLLRTSVTTSSDTNETVTVTNHYPKDNNVTGAHLLEQKNRLAEVVKTETFINSEHAMTREQDYISINANVVAANTISTIKGTALAEEQIQLTYYSNGNIKEVFRPNGSQSTFIWGYDSMLLLARLDGIAYADIGPGNLQFLSNNDIDATSEQTLRNALNGLRTAHPSAQVTTFTYDPLIGVSSITDPINFTSFYNYDQFNRLENIKDEDGNVISTFNYNYAQEAVVYDPLNVGIDYGSDDTDHQWFTANVSDGSGDYSYAWFEGIGSSSTDFDANDPGTADTYQLMVDCSTTKYVKLVVTDNITGEVTEQTKVNTNTCPYPALTVNVTYGTHNDNSQNFTSNVSGGSGNYSYSWHKGVNLSSFAFEVDATSTLPNCLVIVSCTTYKWVKLVVTDTVTGESVVKVTKSNNSPCSGGGGNPIGPDPFDPEQ